MTLRGTAPGESQIGDGPSEVPVADSTARRDPVARATATVASTILNPSTLVPLVVVWAVVALTHILGHDLFTEPIDPAVAAVSFAVILAAIVVAAFRVVQEAEHLASVLGEPYGTLVLTLSVVVIEVILIVSVMLGPGESPTIARDSLFAVMMIILNGVMGVALIVGGLRHGPQRYNREGTSQYLAMIAVLTLLALVLPNFTVSTGAGSFSTGQAIGVAVLAAAAYAVFLWLQTTKNRALFLQPLGARAAAAPAAHAPANRGVTVTHAVLLVLTVLPIVLLSHDLAILTDYGIGMLGAPIALGGVLIALIVFTPEAATAIRASLNNETQRTINLNLGAFVSTVGVTIPAVLVIGLVTGERVILGESPANMLLIAATLALTVITFTSRRTNVVHGVLHLALFGMFALLVFAP
ncbi:MAG: Ca2+:H+ antiporter [Subtercola sp.]|nr:Ca2+:H+ antiporter [Subtercola sp.]